MRATILLLLLLAVFSLVLADEAETGPTVIGGRPVGPSTSVASMSSDVTSDMISQIHSFIADAFENQIKPTYEGYLEEDVTLVGRVVINMALTDGSVFTASIANNTTGNDEMAESILAVAQEWNIDGIEGIICLSAAFVLQP